MDLASLGETARGKGVRLFSPLYRCAMVWSRHPHAPWYLGGMSFAESSFFPIPPDVMLAPMCLANPQHAWRLALLTTLASVAGGMFGYAIGYFAIDAVLPWLQDSRYWPAYQTAVEWFGRWGFWAVFIAGFSPIPYKIFTIVYDVADGSSVKSLLQECASIGKYGERYYYDVQGDAIVEAMAAIGSVISELRVAR